MHVEALSNSIAARRVRDLYYTKEFAEKLFREILLSKSQIRGTWPRFLLDASLSGNELCNLLPGHTGSWWPLVEDVFSSPEVLRIVTSLREECLQHDEFKCLSIDGTMKCCLPLLGQANPSQPKRVRASYLYDDASAIRRIITVRGRTNAVLALMPSCGESAELVVTTFPRAKRRLRSSASWLSTQVKLAKQLEACVCMYMGAKFVTPPHEPIAIQDGL